MDEETLDEILAVRLRIYQSKRGYRFSLDAILLADFVFLKSKDKAIDLGTGSGIIPLILAARYTHTDWIGLEIQERLAALAVRNIDLNCLQDRIKIFHGDAVRIRSLFSAHSFDVVTFNPPYRKIHSGRINPDQEKAIARHEVKGSLKNFLQAAKYLLKPSGKVFTIYPAKRLVELICLFRDSDIEPKRMQLESSDQESSAEFVLAEGRSGSHEELKIDPPLFIYNRDKKYTPEMINIFNGLAASVSNGGD